MSIDKLNQGFGTLSITGGILAFGILMVQHVLKIAVSPTIALYLLALPPLYFYLLSEYAHAAQKEHSHHSAAALTLLLLLLLSYCAPVLITLLALPGYIPGFGDYSRHAPLALVTGILLIRLYAIKKHRFPVFVGLTAVITALFFLSIRLPDWVLGDIPPQSAGKTFEFFTLILIGLSYLFLVTSGTHGLLRTALVKFAQIPDELWHPLKLYLVTLLMAGCHSFLLLSLVFHSDQRLLAVVFLLLAGLWIIIGHQFQQLLFFWWAFAGIVTTIVSGRFTYARWSESWNIWFLLGLMTGIVLVYHGWLKQRYQSAQPHVYAWFGLIVLLMSYEYATTYRLSSNIGLLPFLLVWGLGFCLPARFDIKQESSFQSLLGVWLYMPVLFIFLLQGYPALTHIPRALLATLVLSGIIIAYRVYEWQWFPDDDAGQQDAVVLHHLHWFLTQPYSLLWVFALLTAAALGVHVVSLIAGAGLFTRYLLSMALVQGTLVVYWFDLARKHKLWWATVAAELMVGGLLFSVRRGIPAIFGLPWSTEWDMLIGWGIAVSIVAAKALLHTQDRAVRVPIRITLFGLPILTAMYALDYRVDFEFFALIVLPLYSLLFLFQAYSERDRFVLSYAFVGINAYLLLLFVHQHFHSVQWYVTPVCLSMLILVEVFRDITSAATANVVRSMALFVMLGVAMVQAIVGNALSWPAHALVLALSSLALVIANVLRVKVFATFGLFAFVIDLVAILYIALSRQNIETLMVALGAGLTLIGFLTLGGYYVYRQQKETIDALFTRLHERFIAWE